MAARASTPNCSQPQLSKLDNIRKNSGKADTLGLRDSEISKFLSSDSSLVTAIDEAHDYHLKIREEFGADLLMKYGKLINRLQDFDSNLTSIALKILSNDSTEISLSFSFSISTKRDI